MSDDQNDYIPTDDDDAAGAAIALLSATFSGDAEGAEMLMQAVDPYRVLAVAIGLARSLGRRAFGTDRFAAMLSAWRPGTRLGDGLGPDDDLDRFPDAAALRDQLLRLDRARLEMIARFVAHRLEADLD